MLPRDLSFIDLQRLAPERYSLLLESVADSKTLSRWDFLFIANGEGLVCNAHGQTQNLQGEKVAGLFLDVLDSIWKKTIEIKDNSDLPFRGGWALFFSYELAGQIESRLKLPVSKGPLPMALALRCPAAVLRNKNTGEVFFVAESDNDDLFSSLLKDIAASENFVPTASLSIPQAINEEAPEKFLGGVERIHHYLRQGDTFQVNLSRAWRAEFSQAPEPASLYQSLCRHNPAPFAGALIYKDWALLSSSPERLVSCHGGDVQTRPIAGTRPRFAGDDDHHRIQELVGHPKERAEHVMLIDLERNDLGRVCEPGSVHVDELMGVESYAHVHHIVSNVRGRLCDDVTPGQVIAAVFPGGTITGCPKVRCMEIIAELEAEARGPYTGALGYLNHNGDMDLNILIRSAWLSGTQCELRAGAGIVVDSIAEHELLETRVKAKGLLRALGADV
ncbi:MAG: aminodeoxychorismate synthase component I [Arenimonas sp.]